MLSSNTSAVSGDTVYVEDVFSTQVYAGSGASKTISNGVDLSTKGGLVWTKVRNPDAGSHVLEDTVRGAGRIISSNTTGAQSYTTDTQKTITAFNTTGYTLGDDAGNWGTNFSGENYVSWTFREQPKFFDVVTYTGNGSASQTISHNLGSTPGCIMVKFLNAGGWNVYHTSLGATKFLSLNTTDASTTNSNRWNNTSPTSTQFTVGTQLNQSAEPYVAYVFAHDAGGFGLTGTDNVISCGTFTTDGSGNATVSLGYEPQWLTIKPSSAAGNWYTEDSMRGFNLTGRAILFPNLSNAEAATGNAYLSPSSTGFSAVNGNLDASTTYIYIAIRRGPMKVPTDGTKVFDTQYAYSSSPTYRNTILTDGFIQFAKESGYNKDFYSRLTGTNYLSTNLTAAESTNASLKMDIMNGVYTAVSTPPTYMAWLFRRAPSFFDEVCYTGTGSATTITHNLGVAPELMIVRVRNKTTAENWCVYSQTLGAGYFLALNTTSAKNGSFDSTRFPVAPTSSVFTVGSDQDNGGAFNYVAYLFATCAGVSKVGSYTGTGTTKQVDCGFAAGARFVLIKRTDSTGDWYVWDTARGIVSGNDPYLLLNSTAAEVTSTDYIDTYSAGFELSSTAPAALNASGGTYIFLAIA